MRSPLILIESSSQVTYRKLSAQFPFANQKAHNILQSPALVRNDPILGRSRHCSRNSPNRTGRQRNHAQKILHRVESRVKKLHTESKKFPGARVIKVKSQLPREHACAMTCSLQDQHISRPAPPFAMQVPMRQFSTNIVCAFPHTNPMTWARGRRLSRLVRGGARVGGACMEA